MDVFRDALRHAHHEAAHNDRKELLRAVVADFLLDVREWRDVECDGPGPLRDDPQKRQHLFLRLLGGVGVAEEMDGVQLEPPARHQPTRDGAVNAAGDHQCRAAVDATGQAARARHGVRMDVGRGLADFHMNGELRRAHLGAEIFKGVV